MSESEDEGSVIDKNVQSSQVPGTSSKATGEMQDHLQELARLRDELSRLNAETRAQGENSNPAPARSYIYVPRERHITPFSGEGGTDGRSVEEFIEEVERVLRSGERTPSERCDYIVSLLRGPALEEVRLCMRGQSVFPSDLFSFLRNAFGEKRSATQLLQTFYNRRQADGEDLRDYSHALSQLLSSVMKQSTDAVANEEAVLRDQFIEGLRDAALRRELRKMVRDRPGSCLLDVRDEALRWDMEDSRSHKPRVVKSSHVKSEVSETQNSAIRTNDVQCTVLDGVQKTVAHQEKQLAELAKTLAQLTSVVSELSRRSTQPTYREPQHQARAQPKFTPDGQPICFKCEGVGHIARKCPHARRGQSGMTPDLSVAQENPYPRLS